ncbi:hypothetical protein EVAR_101492_1 [Eumeta japonica]|uniref:Uncharacterized protein n=1 Tax=Eumeta variegata TaxID=151549 RepID=A0A4C1T9E3_EUMVA|nr:hypothetical protein EVAR_101492_1 [Eumeta japonica]
MPPTPLLASKIISLRKSISSIRGENPLVEVVDATVAPVDDDGPPPPVDISPLTKPVAEGLAGIVIRLMPEAFEIFVTEFCC